MERDRRVSLGAAERAAAVLLSSAVLVAACGTRPSGSEERVQRGSSAVTGGDDADSNFLQTYQTYYVQPRTFPGLTFNPANIRQAFAQVNSNRLALGLPHVGAGWLNSPGGPVTCNPACDPSTQGCFEGQCVPQCSNGEIPCETGVPDSSTGVCLCIPEGPGDGGAGEAGASDGGSSSPTGCAWASVGPTNVNGRVTSIAIDPNNNQNVYATGVGGIWRSTNGGRVWQRVSDGVLVTVAGAVAVNPGNSTEIVAGLGDPDYFGSTNTGLVVSTSSGNPGSFTAATGAIANAVVKKIIYSTKGTNDVYVATTLGVFIGQHMGGPLTFSQLGGMSASTSDIAVDLSGATPIVYAALESGSGSFTNGIWKYDGTSWHEKDSGIDTANSQRIALGLAASSTNILYARVEKNDGTLLGLFTTSTGGEPPDGGGNAWTADSAANTSILGDSNYIWWGNVLAVDPSDPNTVFSGGISLYRRTGSGAAAAWSNVSTGPDTTYPLGLHGDQHTIALDPSNPKLVWTGNDGGIYRSTNMSGNWHWTSQAHGMILTEFYRATTEQAISTIVAGGSQDNGTEITFGNRTWYNPAGSDGFDVAVDAVNSSTVFGTGSGRGNVPNSGLFELANPVPYTVGGGSQISFDTSALPANVQIVGPVETDPTTAETALAVGKLPAPASGPTPGMILVKTTNGLKFTQVPLTTSNGTAINTIAISATTNPATSKKVYYVGATVSGSPTIYSSPDEGATWNTTATGLPASLQSNTIAVDPHNALRAFAAFGGGAGGGVAITTNGGGMWTQLPSSGTTALPNAAITGIAVDANNGNTLYITSQIGVYQGTVTTSPAGSSWIPFDQGLPDGVDANRIYLNTATNILTIGTMGHGSFQRDVTPGATCPGTMLVVRDNVFDRGVVPSPSGVADPEHPVLDSSRSGGFYKPDNSSGGSLYWWDSTDVRIDDPSADCASNTIAQADNYEFETCPVEVASCAPGTMVDRSPQRGKTVNAYVQVNNRGLTPATNVRVIAMFADATTHTPDLPSSFWSTTFPAGSSSCGNLDTSTGWNIVGCQVISVVNPELPVVTKFSWSVPSTAADHTCMMTVVDSTEDQIGTSTRQAFGAATVVPGDRHVAQRNLHVIDPPTPPTCPGGPGSPGGGGGPYEGLTSVLVPNRSPVTGVDVILSRSGMGAGRLQFLLPTGTASTVTGLPATCGKTPSSGKVVGLTLPKGASSDQVVIGATQQVLLGLNDAISGSDGFDFITNTGGLGLSVPTGTTVDNLSSVGGITLLSGAKANGSVTSGGSVIISPGATVGGTVTRNATLTPLETTSWALPPSSTSKGSVDVQRGQSITIAPGKYDEINVESGGTLTLQAGTYVVNELESEGTGRIVLSGETSLYVNTVLDLDGPFFDANGNPTNALLVYLGFGVVNLPGGIHATVVAPNALLNLLDTKGYTGGFFASQVVVGAGVNVVHEAGSAFQDLDACTPLTSAEQTKATSLGLDGTQLYGVSGAELVQHLPIPAGQTWTVGLRYEIAAGPPNTAARFRIVEKEQGVVVGGNTFAARH
jgi:hypothetical protein